MILYIVIISSFVLSIHGNLESTDDYNEELFVKQLKSGHVYSMFQFATTWNVNIFEEKFRKFSLSRFSLVFKLKIVLIRKIHVYLGELFSPSAQ